MTATPTRAVTRTAGADPDRPTASGRHARPTRTPAGTPGRAGQDDNTERVTGLP